MCRDEGSKFLHRGSHCLQRESRNVKPRHPPTPLSLSLYQLLKRLDSEWYWDFSPDDSSQGSWDGRQSPLQKSANTWRQCDACSRWRPLSGHIDAEDLPQTW